MIYSICQDANLKPFFEPGVIWTKKNASPHRGLIATTTAPITTAAERYEFLEQLLGLIANYVPHFLQNEVINNSTSIRSVWTTVRAYYGFRQSEATLAKYLLIKQEPDERPERLYYRLLSHIQDNLLTTDSKLMHDGNKCETDEVMCPTLERLIVLHWLSSLHVGLPALIIRTFAFDMQRMTFKDLFPQICEALDGFLEELRQNDISASLASTNNDAISAAPVFSYGNNRQSNRRFPSSRGQPRPRQNGQRPFFKPGGNRNFSNGNSVCWKCKAEGRPHTHDMPNCNFMSHAEKQNIFSSFCEVGFASEADQLDVIYDDEDHE